MGKSPANPKRSKVTRKKTAKKKAVRKPRAQKPPAASPHDSKQREAPILLEIAWEACNKVGGIYTVLRSKVPSMVERWGDRYCLIGPWNEGSASIEFDEHEPVGAIGKAVEQLNDIGVRTHYGRWLVTGRPRIVLIDYLSLFDRLHEIKYKLWNDHGIQLPSDDELMNNVAAFGEGVRLLLWMLANKESGRRKIVAHFHEWMAGSAIPMLRKDDWPGGIVFTTHATLLGRYLAMNHPAFYDHLPFFDADEEAKKYNVDAQYRLERAAVHGANVFTTVSDVTGFECENLLGRKPKPVLPNGLNIQRFEQLHEMQNLHRESKEKIHEFTTGHFFPSYNFDLDNTLYFFTSGRYEYKNKGMDLTLEALARLNYRLQLSGSNKTIVAFFITKRPVKSINVHALQTRAMLDEFKTIADAMKEQVGDGVFRSGTVGKIPDLNGMVDEYWLLRMRRAMHAWKSQLPPSVVTHDLVDDEKDEVLNQLRNARMWNQQENPVKVIYHPDFINSTNPLLPLEYEQFVRGCHLGIFPSYYEPWGYTPLESIALGVPAITSDVSGFGDYQLKVLDDAKGLFCVRRRYCSFDQSADELADIMFQFTQMEQRERIALRNKAEHHSEKFGWHHLASRYHEAHDMAIDMID